MSLMIGLGLGITGGRGRVTAFDPPTVANPLVDQNGLEEFSYQFASNTFSDPAGGTLSYAATLSNGDPLPGWLTFTSGTRTFSGTAPAGADITVRVTATSSVSGLSVFDDFVIFLPVYAMNFAAGDALHADFTFTRTTAAWRRNNTGLWESVGTGVLRYHHSAAGSPLGILIEESRTSVALWNRDLTNVVWVAVTATTAKNATGIDGAANSASTLTASANNGTLLQTLVLASGTRVFHPWVRRKTGTGTVEITLNGGTNWTDITSLINGSTYSQVAVTATVTNPSVGFRLGTSGDAIEVDFAALTEGTFATSPIAATTASVTRNADVIAGPNWPAAWTMRADGVFNASQLEPVLFGRDNSIPSRVFVDDSPLGTLSHNDGSGSVLTAANTIANGASFKAIAREESSVRRLCLNGGTVATGATAAQYSGPIRVGSRGGGSLYWSSTIARLKLWDRALLNAELQSETTG